MLEIFAKEKRKFKYRNKIEIAHRVQLHEGHKDTANISSINFQVLRSRIANNLTLEIGIESTNKRKTTRLQIIKSHHLIHTNRDYLEIFHTVASKHS